MESGEIQRDIREELPEINIVNFIPYGEENAVSRNELRRLTGANDRINRMMIHEARRDYVILNSPKNGGYYRPTEREEIENISRWLKQEYSRAIHIFEGMAGAKKRLLKLGE